MKKTTIAVTALAVALAGCATHAPSKSESSPVPDDRVYSHQDKTGARTVPIRFTVDNPVGLYHYQGAIYIDGEKAAEPKQSENVTFYVTPEKHHFKYDPGFWDGGIDVSDTIDLSDGERKCIRLRKRASNYSFEETAC